MADITNEHFSYNFETPVYQPIRGLGDAMEKLGQNAAFREFTNEYNKRQQEQEQVEVKSETSNDYAKSLGMTQVPKHYKPRNALQKREDILSGLTEAYPNIPSPELEVMADQRFNHQKLNRQYEENSRMRDLAFELGKPGLMDYYDKRDINLGNQLRESERGLKGIESDLNNKSKWANQLSIMYRDVVDTLKNPNFKYLSKDVQNKTMNDFYSLRAQMALTPEWAGTFAKNLGGTETLTEHDSLAAQMASDNPAAEITPKENPDLIQFIKDGKAKGTSRSELEFLFKQEWKKGGQQRNTEDFADYMEFIEKQFAEDATQEQKKERANDKAYERGQDKLKTETAMDDKYSPLYAIYTDLGDNPDTQTISRGINLALRKESGAAISASEYESMMKNLLDKKDRENFIKEITGAKSILFGLANDDLRVAHIQKIAEKYLSSVNPKTLQKYIKPKIPPAYFELQAKRATKKSKEVQYGGDF